MLPSPAVISGKVRWQVAPELRDLLLGPEGLRLEEWRRGGRVRIVKQGPHRAVYHVILNGLSFFVKHNRLPNLRAWLRQLVRPSKARKEYEHALAISARGVPTFVPLAIGERSGLGPGASFLITQSLENTEPVGAFIELILPKLEPHQSARVRQRLARELGQLVVRMHQAGVAHHDFHAGNLLVQLAADDRPSVYLIDLHALRIGAALSWRAIQANLVMLNRWFVMRVSRTDRLRFWRAYCRIQEASEPAGLPRELALGDLARTLEQRTWRSNLRFWGGRDRRCLVNNRYYRRVHAAGVQGHAVADLDPGLLAALLANPDEPFGRPGVRLIKDSPSSTVAEIEGMAPDLPQTYIYKRFRVASWTDPWRSLLRRPAALRSWLLGHGLRERCLPTARPLLVLHRKRYGVFYEGYLLTEKIERALDLHAHLHQLDSLPLSERKRELHEVIDRVARLARELHRRRMSHRDLKAPNILVSGRAGDPDGPLCWLIDLVGIERYRKLSRARRVQNLARLHASFHDSPCLSRTDRVRFLRVYLAWGFRGREGWKRWWHEIEQATQAKIARNLRNGRPLA